MKDSSKKLNNAICFNLFALCCVTIKSGAKAQKNLIQVPEQVGYVYKQICVSEEL